MIVNSILLICCFIVAVVIMGACFSCTGDYEYDDYDEDYYY